MMFCWLHILTVSFWFLKVLWVVMAAATLSDPKEVVGKYQSASFERTTVNTQIHIEEVAGFNDVSEKTPNSNNNSVRPIEFSSVILGNESTSNIESSTVSREVDDSTKIEPVTIECDEVCADMKRGTSTLSQNFATVRRFPFTASRNDDVLSAKIQEKESKLKERDISSTYELDNRPKIDNNTRIEDVRFKTVKGVNNDNRDVSTSADHLSAEPTINLDQTGNNSLSVSSNKTVNELNSETKENASSPTVQIDKTKVTSKPNVDTFTSIIFDKFSKGYSGNVKPTVKMSKNRTLQEIKPGTQIKYSEESKKKVLVKTLNEDSDNVSLQMEVTQADEDSSVLLMNDGPENAAVLNRNRGSVRITSDDDNDDGSLVFPPHDLGNSTTEVNASVIETNETFSTAAHGHIQKPNEESSFTVAIICGIAIGVLIISSVIGAVSFILYRHRYWNKPHTLSDKCSNADSSGYIDDSTLRDNSEEMYSLDNDSFLNSLEAMTIQNYWTDNVKHTKL